MWLCADETAIEKKIEYDTRNDEVIGFALPLDTVTGMPIRGTFKARSLAEVDQHFIDNPRASDVMAVVAVPLNRPASPFNILLYASNKKFKSVDLDNQ